MQESLMLRHRVTMNVRRFLDQNGFGNRDPNAHQTYSRRGKGLPCTKQGKPGSFALPQSPQLFKQLLMASGVDKYFQIARCFRDEDLRADRQPEFTQIDIEMSFVDMEDIISLNERLMANIFEENLGVKLKMPFKRMTYKQAMEDYGSDKPDTRFEMKLVCIKDIVAGSGFRVFSDTAGKGGDIRGINAKGCGDSLSRREIDALVEYVKQFGAKGLAWIVVTAEGVKSPIAKFVTSEETDAIVERMDGKPGDLLLIVADRPG